MTIVSVGANCSLLTHWGRVTHICFSKLTIIGSDNGLSPGRRQTIIWTNDGLLLIGPLGTNFNESLVGIQTFSFKKMHLKVSSAKGRLFSPGLNELTFLMLKPGYSVRIRSITCLLNSWAPSQYLKRRLSVRSRKVSKPRNLYLELSDRSAIWQALRQQCCRCACQISKRYDNLKYQSRGFETLRDLTIRRLIAY